MRIVKQYSNLPEAHLDLSRLRDAGIPCEIAGENTGSIGYGGIFNEIAINVADQDFDRATAVLEEPAAPLPADAEFEDAPSPLPVSVEPTNPAEPSVLLWFLTGGIGTLGLVGILFLIAIASGGEGEVYADFGGLIILFILGGIVSLIARAFYVSGLRRSAKKQ